MTGSVQPEFHCSCCARNETLAVSGSFSVDEVKWLVFYGENKEKNFDLKTEDKGELDYAITQMFLMMKESSRFDMDRVEKSFWERVTALANYR